MPNFMRLAIGTLTRIPVPAPDNVNRHVARLAMSFAPVVGLMLALIVGIPMLGLVLVVRPEGDALAAALIALLAIAFLAWLTRAIHLDGLADTADALGSGQPAERALEIARRSDIGPFGVIAIVVALAAQGLGLTAALAAGHGLLAFALAVLAGRIAITAACTRGIPAARADGLGSVVASSVPVAVTVLWAVVLLGTAAGLALAEGAAVLPAVVASAAGLLAGLLVVGIARRRLGGVTGDVLGAAAEIASATVLLTLGLALSAA